MVNSLFYNAASPWADIYYVAGRLGGGYYGLYTEGCLREGETQANCAVACSNQTWLYGSTQRLNNCLVAPYIAARLSALDKQAVQDAQSFGIFGAPTLNSNYSSAIAGCLNQTCVSSAACASHGNACRDLEGPNNTLASASLQKCFRNLCLDASYTTDADIGGIGVSISYLIQLGIAVGGYLLLSCFSSWTYLFFRLALLLTEKDKAKSIATHAQSRLRSHRLALVPALEEFHRTQCFFGIAVNIAAMVVMRTGDSKATNITQAQNLLRFIELVATNGLLLIPFTFWYLRKNTERSWYNLLLTLTAFALSLATFRTALWRDRHADTMAVVPLNQDSQCGNSSPTALCTPEIYQSSPVSPGILSIWPILVFVVYLVLDHLWVYYQHLLPFVRSRRFSIFSRGFSTLMGVCLLLLFGAYIALQITAFKTFLAQGAIDQSTWSIGQIVGVTIWAQPVLEFVQLDLAGMAKGFSHRLPRGYSIKKQSEPRKLLDDFGNDVSKTSFETFLDGVDNVFFCALRPPLAEPFIQPQGVSGEQRQSQASFRLEERINRGHEGGLPLGRQDSQTSALETGPVLPISRIVPQGSPGRR